MQLITEGFADLFYSPEFWDRSLFNLVIIIMNHKNIFEFANQPSRNIVSRDVAKSKVVMFFKTICCCFFVASQSTDRPENVGDVHLRFRGTLKCTYLLNLQQMCRAKGTNNIMWRTRETRRRDWIFNWLCIPSIFVKNQDAQIFWQTFKRISLDNFQEVYELNYDPQLIAAR